MFKWSSEKYPKSVKQSVGWRINMKNFMLAKAIEISFMDEKPYPIHAGHGIRTYDLQITR